MEVRVTVHPENGPGQVVRVHISVYVPKTDYGNLVLVARCRGQNGFPVTIDPYFAGGHLLPRTVCCRARTGINSMPHCKISQSREVLSFAGLHATTCETEAKPGKGRRAAVTTAPPNPTVRKCHVGSADWRSYLGRETWSFCNYDPSLTVTFSDLSTAR